MADGTLKLVVIGESQVGKTALLTTYKEGSYPQGTLPELFDNSLKEIEVHSKKYSFGLWDTGGRQEQDRLRPNSYPHANVFFLCFSVSNPETFTIIKGKWTKELKQHAPGVPVILVGLKADTRGDVPKPVTQQQGEKLAHQIKAICYMECSSKTGEGVKDLFDKAIDISIHPPPPPINKDGACLIS